MARIRTIKPEFWSSPSTAKASPVARLAFIAMWNWADDHGRGTANLKELEGFIFPNDDIQELSSGNTVHFRELVAEVSECFNVEFYTVSGRPFYQIPTWDQHQRNERRAAQSKYPGPDQADTPITPPTRANTEDSGTAVNEERKYRDPVAEIPHTSGTGTGEQGNRGTGEVKTPPSPATPSKEFEAFWAVYPKKVSKQAALKAWKKAIKLADAETIIKGARQYAELVKGAEKQFIKGPDGWLNAGRWEDEAPTAPAFNPNDWMNQL